MLCLSLSGRALMRSSQLRQLPHLRRRSSAVMSTPSERFGPHGSEFTWIIGKKLDRITRNVSHARVQWLQKIKYVFFCKFNGWVLVIIVSISNKETQF